MKEFIDILKKTFKGDSEYSQSTLEKYSRDASLLKVLPELIVFPKDTEDVQTLVKTVKEARALGQQVNLTARSAGTDMSGGPLTSSVVVEFPRYFNKIIEIGKGYGITQPGVYYRDFDKATLLQDEIMPSYPASREICTVGGMVANNSGGEKTLFYGKTEDYILELKGVLADGNEYTFKPLIFTELEEKKKLQTFEGDVYRKLHALIEKNFDLLKAAKPGVSKNSAGYYLWNVMDKEKEIFDITKVLVGSQGTLGLITQIKFRLVKPKTHSRLLVVFMTSMKGLGDLTNHILAFKPESLESYDDHTFKLAAKFFPQMIKQMKGNVITLMLRFIPEFWAIITGGIPKLVLLAEFTADSDEEAHDIAMRAQESLKEFNVKTKVTNSEGDVKKYWTIRRESFNMLRHHVKNLRTAPFIDDFVVPPPSLPEFLPKLYSILDEYHLTYTVAGHVGDGNFHIIPLMDLKKAESIKAINELMERVNSLVIEYKGSITGEHNDGIIRTPFLERMYGKEVCALFKETKNIFDPDNIFNPGKKVDGTWEYAISHLDIT